MAIILEAAYSKKLGLPNYSSHSYVVSSRTEPSDLTQVEAESARLYALLQQSVDGQDPRWRRPARTAAANPCQRTGTRNAGRSKPGAWRAGARLPSSPKGPRYDQKFKDQVVAASQDGMSTRGIQRTFGVCYQTLRRWVGKKIQGLPAFADTQSTSV